MNERSMAKSDSIEFSEDDVSHEPLKPKRAIWHNTLDIVVILVPLSLVAIELRLLLYRHFLNAVISFKSALQMLIKFSRIIYATELVLS
jgi:hypothetical protein